MSTKNIVFILLLFSLLSSVLPAQSTFIPLHNNAYHILDRLEIKSGSLDTYVFSSVKPYLRFDAVLYAEDADQLEGVSFRAADRLNHSYIFKDNTEWAAERGLRNSKKPIFKHLYKYRSDLFHLENVDDFMLKINPVLHLQIGKEFGTDGIQFINTRGLEIRGMVAEKLGFYTFLGENQASFPSYIHNNIRGYGAVPGEGRYKIFDSRIGFLAPGVDYFTARGYLTYQPIRHIRVQFGHDKHFVGNGIRSLLLSDFSNAMLFLKVNTKIWKFNYQNLFAELVGQFDVGADGLLPKKYMATHHLSINFSKWLNIGFFETTIFDREQGFDFQYLNPVIFYRAIEFQLGSSDNVILGMDYKINFLKHFSLYGQLVIDEFSFSEIFDNNGWWGNKFGWQAGLKYIDMFGISNLDGQLEWNTVRPYTYTHNSASANYTHYNLPLAHPLGANFREILGVFRYKLRKDVDMQLNLMYAQYGADPDSSNVGTNIFLDSDTRDGDYANFTTQGLNTNVFLADFRLSYMWKHNFFFDLVYTYRNSNSDLAALNQSKHFVGLGMRLNVDRRQYLY